MARKKILWLCSWYPGKLEPYNGDFIQRHAQAAALYHDIHVIHVYGDASGRIREFVHEITEKEHLTEELVYFPKNRGRLGKMIGAYRWLYRFRNTIRNYIRQHGVPDLVHVNIPVKAGIFGLWMKRRYKIPYVVSEHWAIYNNNAADRFNKRSTSFRQFTRKVFANASHFISVSDDLAKNIMNSVIPLSYSVIPNVVNTGLFHYSEIRNPVFRFIHVSILEPRKNPEGILRVFTSLISAGENAELVMVGKDTRGLEMIAKTMGMGSRIRFTGEISYAEVAKELRQANCLVLYSNQENSPCVIGEAFCCGLPVIATRVGGIPELINEKNGLLVEPGNDEDLKEAMLHMTRHFTDYDRTSISQQAKDVFSYPVIGKQFDEVYRQVLIKQG